MKNISKVFDFCELVIKVLCVIVLAAVCLLIAAQVIIRKSGGAITWADEVSRYLFLLLVLYGSILVNRHGEQIQITSFLNMLSKKKRKVVDVVIYVLVLAFNILFTYGVYRVMSTSGTLSFSVLTMIKLKYFYFLCFVAMILSNISLIFFIIEIILSDDIHSQTKLKNEGAGNV